MTQFFEKINLVLFSNGAIWSILKGLWVTVKISGLAVLFGTIIGALLSVIRIKSSAALKGFVRLWVELLRGIPVSLLLIMMYYVVFAKTTLSAEWIAIITFSLNMSAYVTEIICSAVSAIDKGQIEAARTLGFSTLGAFRFVMLPQIWKTAKSVYQSEIINIIQWTSVVSFITITDLTRVINLFAARTLQPVFMICIGMLLYKGLDSFVTAMFRIRKRG